MPGPLPPPCSTNGPGGPTTCYLYAWRGTECVDIVLLDRGEVGAFNGGQVSDPNRMVARLTDHFGPSGGQCPWRGATPSS